MIQLWGSSGIQTWYFQSWIWNATDREVNMVYPSLLWTTRLQVQIVIETEFILWLYGTSLHRAFHYHFFIILWLSYCWQRSKMHIIVCAKAPYLHSLLCSCDVIINIIERTLNITHCLFLLKLCIFLWTLISSEPCKPFKLFVIVFDKPILFHYQWCVFWGEERHCKPGQVWDGWLLQEGKWK